MGTLDSYELYIFPLYNHEWNEWMNHFDFCFHSIEMFGEWRQNGSLVCVCVCVYVYVPVVMCQLARIFLVLWPKRVSCQSQPYNNFLDHFVHVTSVIAERNANGNGKRLTFIGSQCDGWFVQKKKRFWIWKQLVTIYRMT